MSLGVEGERERGVNLLNSYLTLISMWINTIFAHKISP